MPSAWDPLDVLGAPKCCNENESADLGDGDLEHGFEKGYIYEVPKNIRQGNEKAYTPQLISIGPLHYRKKNLVKMAQYKLVYRRKFRERTSTKTLEEFWNYIEGNEKNIRDCYQASSIIDEFWSVTEHNNKTKTKKEQKFVRMIFYDALFIVELFLRNYEKDKENNSGIKDFFLDGTWPAGLRRDLMLLENQIPLFILQELYRSYRTREHKLDSACASHASALPFLRHACHYFDIAWDEQFQDMNIQHFTALQRSHWVKNFRPNPDPSMPQEGKTQTSPFEVVHSPTKSTPSMAQEGKSWTSASEGVHSATKSDPSMVQEGKTQTLSLEKVHSATKLSEVGVKFTLHKQSACLLDIKFEGKELKIPEFTVHSNTEAYIRNVMAFEMCHCPGEAYVCAYIELMNYLIKTDKDVDLLMDNKILSNEGRNEGILVSRINPSKALAGMIKKLMQGVGEAPLSYQETAIKLNEYENDLKHRIIRFCTNNLGTLKRVYFTNLWRGTGTVAAFMVVVLTLIQTVLAFRK
ncbi:UPF0481 protein At3g47200-like [Durio zibethinus]|uniref:UPF0481 protein At3g47200-like n=1 Tax=Durio zibethinus TaxID=66656 RepID=A0A6P5WVE4_DURZI|nr:UPF0481 protein At3g47200-like [Durio zibethinus]